MAAVHTTDAPPRRVEDVEPLSPVDPADLDAPTGALTGYEGTNISASSGCHQCC